MCFKKGPKVAVRGEEAKIVKIYKALQVAINMLIIMPMIFVVYVGNFIDKIYFDYHWF